jgi:hypothetical protein
MMYDRNGESEFVAFLKIRMTNTLMTGKYG